MAAAANDKPNGTPEERRPDPAGQGMEISDRPAFQEFHNPGLEVLEPSNLEVVFPPPGPPHLAGNGWEKTNEEGYTTTSSPQTPYGAAPAYSSTGGSNVIPYDKAPLMVSELERRAGPGAGGVGEAKEEPKTTGKIMGLRRQMFFILLAVAVFFGVLAIAAGVGVGFALRKTNDSGSTARWVLLLFFFSK